ncbi:MAG TPA: VTT domain-containing protein [Actinophytocola sp.]|nr:VTT domain-containing protein [Actinophytocola sp.]
MDLIAGYGVLLHSLWVLPLLTAMIAADAPFPVLPSETLLMSASAMAFAEQNAAIVIALFVAALIGSAAGDMITFLLGRTSHRLLSRSFEARCTLSGWVDRHLHLRPGVALIGARFVPGGRLVSTAAAGRYGLPLRRFLPWTVASSAAWAGYMLVIGLVLGPLTGGSPLLSLLAGVVMAVLTAGLFAVVRSVRSCRGSAAPAPVAATLAEAA